MQESRKISFFAEKNLLGSIIRGKQIADYIGGKYNPKEGYENDICIYIKPSHLNKIRDNDYVDVSDGNWVPDLLKERPKIRAIVNSLYGYQYLKEKLKNEIILIPQQHLNWERAKRERNGITKCGYIGKHSKIADKIYEEIGVELKKISFEFEFFSDFFTREDAINFFKRIDLLIIGPWKGDGPFKTPTKLINAASFGIPSVADAMPQYKEFENYYVPFVNIENMLKEVEKFRDENYYKNFAKNISKKAEEYHISKIGELYKNLRYEI